MIVDLSVKEEPAKSKNEDEKGGFKQNTQVSQNVRFTSIADDQLSYLPLSKTRTEHDRAHSHVHLNQSYRFLITRDVPYSSVLHRRLANMRGKSTARIEITVATRSSDLWFVMNWKFTN